MIGKIFKLSPGGTYKVLYTFCLTGWSTGVCPDGNYPESGLTYDGAAEGNLYDGVSPLYGVTRTGGKKNQGVLYQFSPSSGERNLHDFCTHPDCGDGYFPLGPIVVDGGTVYGSTFFGGANGGLNGCGVVYELSVATGKETIRHSFPNCSASGSDDGSNPQGVILGQGNLAGVLFGTTPAGGLYNAGIIWKMDVSKGTEKPLYEFCGGTNCDDGGSPSGLTQLSGALFGTASSGGTTGHGVIFERPNRGYKVIDGSFCNTCTISPVVPYGNALFGIINNGPGSWGAIYQLRSCPLTWCRSGLRS
jgi:uncharacterized repeat protein (TIGR03803 family)